jgi:Mn2+/Fe2+ NRAMP family transporter
MYLLAVYAFNPENTSVWSSALNWITRDTAERHISYVFFAIYCVSLVLSSINKSFAAKLTVLSQKLFSIFPYILVNTVHTEESMKQNLQISNDDYFLTSISF